MKAIDVVIVEPCDLLSSDVLRSRDEMRIAQIMLDSGCGTYVLSTDFTNAGNIPCFPCKPIPVELAIRNASQFTLSTQTKKLQMEVGSIT
jgi:hypothetical protein